VTDCGDLGLRATHNDTPERECHTCQNEAERETGGKGGGAQEKGPHVEQLSKRRTIAASFSASAATRRSCASLSKRFT
jgi:hypothetical protein